MSHAARVLGGAVNGREPVGRGTRARAHHTRAETRARDRVGKRPCRSRRTSSSRRSRRPKEVRVPSQMPVDLGTCVTAFSCERKESSKPFAWGRSNARHRARERGNERASHQTCPLSRLVDVSRGFRRILRRRPSHYRQIQTLTVTFFFSPSQAEACSRTRPCRFCARNAASCRPEK